MGKALYPHPQCHRLARAWEAFYPKDGLDETRRSLLAKLEARLLDFVTLLITHRPEALRGGSLVEAMELEDYGGRMRLSASRPTICWRQFHLSSLLGLERAKPNNKFDQANPLYQSPIDISSSSVIYQKRRIEPHQRYPKLIYKDHQRRR